MRGVEGGLLALQLRRDLTLVETLADKGRCTWELVFLVVLIALWSLVHFQIDVVVCTDNTRVVLVVLLESLHWLVDQVATDLLVSQNLLTILVNCRDLRGQIMR